MLLGRGRRLEAATRGGGMRDVVGLGGGAMRVGLLGGGMEDEEGALEVLCAEFMAGNEGGGKLSSSSSSELSCSLSVNDGTAGTFCSDFGSAFGVDSGDGLLVALPSRSCFAGDCSSMRGSGAGVSSSLSPCCDFSGIVRAPGCVARVMKATHVDGGRWYTRKESDRAKMERATSMSCLVRSECDWTPEDCEERNQSPGFMRIQGL